MSPDDDVTDLMGVNPTIEVDGRRYRAPGTRLTGAQILALAGVEPEDRVLYATGHHALPILPEQPVEVMDGARFETREP